MKALFIVLCILIITWILYPTIQQYLFIFRSVNAGECLNLPDGTDCIQRKIDEATTVRKWWQLSVVYFPSGTYHISSALNIRQNVSLKGKGAYAKHQAF